MDLLTGQNKANFKIWYANWQEQNDYYKAFHKLPFAMQEGVLKAYYRNIELFPDVINPNTSTNLGNENDEYHSICEAKNNYFPIDFHKTYEDAIKQAFKVANELINQNIKA